MTRTQKWMWSGVGLVALLGILGFVFRTEIRKLYLLLISHDNPITMQGGTLDIWSSNYDFLKNDQQEYYLVIQDSVHNPKVTSLRVCADYPCKTVYVPALPINGRPFAVCTVNPHNVRVWSADGSTVTADSWRDPNHTAKIFMSTNETSSAGNYGRRHLDKSAVSQYMYLTVGGSAGYNSCSQTPENDCSADRFASPCRLKCKDSKCFVRMEWEY